MSIGMLIFPALILGIGIVVMVVLNMRGKSATGVAQNVMKEYAYSQIPMLREKNFEVINLLEDAVNAQHIWVIAYDPSVLFLIPSISNPLTRTIKRYEDMTPAFNLKKAIASNLLVGSKSEDIEHLQYSEIDQVTIDPATKKIQISVGGTTKKFKYMDKDCFGADQKEALERFFTYLKS
ncbi:MAG: hypothetical protein Q4D77_00040 [Peptostreptococcaceae bacterium]|nr:hypothetical protein [Peptostreptococcaceae bacterium]